MNIAYLILTYYQPDHFAKMIKALNCEGAFFFIHIDLKSDISVFKAAVPPAKNIIYLENSARLKHYWGGFNMVRATLNLLQRALNFGVHFHRFCLLSGSDFPIKNNSFIKEKLSGETEFLGVGKKIIYPKEDFDSKTSIYLKYKNEDIHLKNVKYVHLYDYRLFNPRSTPSWWFYINMTEKVLIRIRRKPYKKIPLYQGSSYWALTNASVRYIFDFLKKNNDYISFFKYTSIADETFFHSILKSSPYAENIVHDFEKGFTWENESSNENGCHYIDWNSKGIPLPKVLDTADLPSLLKSNMLFARKFEEGHSDSVLKLIQEVIQTSI